MLHNTNNTNLARMPDEEVNISEVDIREYPQLDNLHPSDGKNQLTIGDCHANPLKIIHFLIKQNVLSLSKEGADYKKLYDIFEKYNDKDIADLTTTDVQLFKRDIQEFKKILKNATVHPVARVRFIGDMISDRGPNDYFILKILETLDDQNVPFEVLLSNHDLEFILAHETKESFEPTIMRLNHDHSMVQMQKLIDKGVISRKDVINTFDKHYKPNLRVLNYSLSPDNKQITLFSHAPVDYTIVESIVKKLNIESQQFGSAFNIIYNDATANELANTIDQINRVFAHFVKKNLVHTLFDLDLLQRAYTGGVPIDPEINPFEFITYNRNSDLTFNQKHPKGFDIAYGFGHTNYEDEPPDYIFPLNKALGQYEPIYDNKHFNGYGRKVYQADYYFHFSQSMSPPNTKKIYHCNLIHKRKLEEQRRKKLENKISVFDTTINELLKIDEDKDNHIYNTFKALRDILNTEIIKKPKKAHSIIIDHFSDLAVFIKTHEGDKAAIQKEIDVSSEKLDEKLSGSPPNVELRTAMAAVIGAVAGFAIGLIIGGAISAPGGGFGAIPAAIYGGVTGYTIATTVGFSFSAFSLMVCGFFGNKDAKKKLAEFTQLKQPKIKAKVEAMGSYNKSKEILLREIPSSNFLRK